MSTENVETLADDMAMEGSNGHYRLELSSQWQGIGPFGGYLAALAVRAVGLETHLSRPGSFQCQFLNVGQFAPAEIHVRPLRAGKRAACYQVDLVQGDAPLMTAQIWAVDHGLKGFEHDHAPIPDIAKPEELKPLRSYFEEMGFLDDVGTATLRGRDRRPLQFFGAAGGPSSPLVREWTRFEPQPTFGDPFVDAGRALVLLDNMAGMAHFAVYEDWSQLPFFLPSLDLTAQFLRPMNQSEWLLGQGHADLATSGLAGGTAHIWREDGQLAVLGTSVCLCKPRELYPQD